MFKKIIFLVIIAQLIACGSGNTNINDPSVDKQDDKSRFFIKPTGQYGVGFQDFHWINKDGGTDFNYDGTNNDDFSPDNQERHYHEIVSRIYYPTAQMGAGSEFFKPTIKADQELLSKIPGITAEHLQQLNTLRSYATKDMPIVAGKIFPVVIFSPGFSEPIENYENTITELVSHGYIVVGYSGSFMHLLELPNGHVVQPTRFKECDDIKDPKARGMCMYKIYETKCRPQGIADMSYILNKIKDSSIHHSTPIFSAMDLKHIGAFGHSMGGSTTVDIAHTHPEWLKAAVSLDAGHEKSFDESAPTFSKVAIPFMHIIAADRPIANIGRTFKAEMGDNGYLVDISPNEKNYVYSEHRNFSGYSTWQYLPAWKIYKKYYDEQGWHRRSMLQVGTGDGWKIAHSVNTYVVKFFDTYLKNQEDPRFKQCTALSSNTFMKCGPLVWPAQ